MCYYLLTFNLDRSDRSCNPFDDSSGRICIPDKTEYVNLNISNMITISKGIKNIYNANINVNVMVENVIQIKSRITIIIDVSTKVQ